MSNTAMKETAVATLPEFETLMADIPGSEGKLTMTHRAMFWLLKNANERIVTHRVMWDTLYGAKPECDWPTQDVIKTHICHLRKLLPGWEIRTHHGIGYSMVSKFKSGGISGAN